MSGFLIFISMVTGTASFIALFRPLPRIGLPTRKRAAVVWAASWVLVVIGGALAPEPTPEELADRAEAEPEAECLEVIEVDLVEFLPATHAVLVQFDLNSPEAQRVAERFRSSRGWILASPAGGLWLTYKDPSVPSSTGLTLAMTEQAQAEAEFGSAGGPGAPGLMGLTQDHTLAQRARECAS